MIGPTTVDVRSVLFDLQGGLCAVCRVPGRPYAERERRGKLVVDHDHATGLVRGLLCQGCNQWEGQVRSELFNVVADDALLAYLANPPAAGRGWMWDLPDPPRPTFEESNAWLQSVVLPPQVSADPGPPAEPPLPEPAPTPRPRRRSWRREMTAREAVAALQKVDLPVLNNI